MNRKVLLLLGLLVILFASCVPAKDLIYLQGDANASAQVVNPVSQRPYRLQVNDILYITIKTNDKEKRFTEIFQPTSDPTLNRTEQSIFFDGFTIDDHGQIRMPMLNEISVLGFTVDEVRQDIEKRLLDDYFTSGADLFVTVKLSGFRYTINGEVLSPGTKTLYQEKVNIMEAIANAGDITLTGNRKDVMIIRQMPQGSEIHNIDLTKRESISSPYYYLQPNDYVYVKPLPQKTLGTGATAAQSLTTIISVLSLLTTVTILITR